MVTIIKLNNNTEIIGKIVEEDKNSITLENPLTINYKQKNETPMPIAFLCRYMPFAIVKPIVFKKNFVINQLEPLPYMINFYNITVKLIEEKVDILLAKELVSIGVMDNANDTTPENEILMAMMEKELFNKTIN